MHRERWSEKEGAEGQERKREVDDEEDEGRRLRERKRVREGGREREWSRADVPAPFTRFGSVKGPTRENPVRRI